MFKLKLIQTEQVAFHESPHGEFIFDIKQHFYYGPLSVEFEGNVIPLRNGNNMLIGAGDVVKVTISGWLAERNQYKSDRTTRFYMQRSKKRSVREPTAGCF